MKEIAEKVEDYLMTWFNGEHSRKEMKVLAQALMLHFTPKLDIVLPEKLIECVEELLEVANLRGDNELPHPADDNKLWTARMQTAWDELQEAIDKIKEVIEGRGKDG